MKQMNTVTWHETNEYYYLAWNKWILLLGMKQMNTVTWHETNEYCYLAWNKWILLLGMKQMTPTIKSPGCNSALRLQFLTSESYDDFIFSECLGITTVQSVGTTCPMTQRHTPNDLDLHQCPWENLNSCIWYPYLPSLKYDLLSLIT